MSPNAIVSAALTPRCSATSASPVAFVIPGAEASSRPDGCENVRSARPPTFGASESSICSLVSSGARMSSFVTGRASISSWLAVSPSWAPQACT
jgi:hypothetical protein